MALNWKYIKGFNSTDGENFKYSWITFAANGASQQNTRPQLYYSDTNDFDNATLFGYLLCSATVNSVSDNFGFSWADSGFAQFIWNINNQVFYTIWQGGTPLFGINISNCSVTPYMTMSNGATIYNGATITNGGLSIVGGGIVASGSISAGSHIYSQGFIQGSYFNATSDIRAKTNIKPITTSVLPIVKQMNLYTYIYKDNNVPSIGIMAQDIDWTLNDFDFVQNRSATGKNGDYMSIHESKLVFVLWKAVQELAQEVENLKSKIEA